MIKEWQLAAFASYQLPQRILEAFLLLSAFGGGLPGRPAAMSRLYILENNESKLVSWIRLSRIPWSVGWGATYIRYASVLMYSSTWLMPSKYCSAIGWTHSFSSIFNTDLLLCKSRKPATKLMELTFHSMRMSVRRYYQFPAAKLSIDCSECEARAIVSFRRFHAEYPANRCHAIRARTGKFTN